LAGLWKYIKEKDGLFRPSTLLFIYQTIARKLLSGRACNPKFL
jgi:hypothetical protein